MLLDDWLPKYDFTEVHTIKIKSSPEAAYRAIKETTMAEISGMVRLLFTLRELPEKLAGRGIFEMKSQRPLIEDGFTKLDEQVPRELVVGLIVPGMIGRVWNQSSRLDNIEVTDAQAYSCFCQPDYLKVVANMLVEDTDEPGVVRVRTESRTKGLSDKARKNFRPYWAIIRPWSGLIRRLWLKAIKRRAERNPEPATSPIAAGS